MPRHSWPHQLVLVRHGETEWNQHRVMQGQRDIPLSARGRQQAVALATRLRNWDIDIISSSDLQRAAETAEILGREVGLTPELDKAWREFDLGRWSGLTGADLEARYPDELARLLQGEDIRRGGGENAAMVQARVSAAFERLARLYPSGRILVVSHGGTIRCLICHLIGLELRLGERLRVAGNTGISIIEFGSGRPQLIKLNDTCHLGGQPGD